MKKPFPRILPLVVIAAGGALALRLISGAASLPDIAAGAKAWAEELAPGSKGAANISKPQVPAADPAKSGPSPSTPADPIMAATQTPTPAVCAPTPAELAKQAGLSPAELQTLQNLGARRTQLDDRERDMSTQLALLSAAETKVDAKLKQLADLKAGIQGLLGQADQEKSAEVDRLVNVFQAMKPKDAAARFSLLDDSVRLPVAAKMKDKSLSAILAQMSPPDAKVLTEKLAQRMSPADQARDALASNSVTPPAPAAGTQASATPPGAPGQAKAAPAAGAAPPAANAKG